MTTSLFTVPVSIEAKSRDEMTKLMLAVQGRLSRKVSFFDIQFVQGKWVAWYEIDLKSQLIKTD